MVLVVARNSRPWLHALHEENSFDPNEQAGHAGLRVQNPPCELAGQHELVYRFGPVCRRVVASRLDPRPQRVVASPLDPCEAVFLLDQTC